MVIRSAPWVLVLLVLACDGGDGDDDTSATDTSDTTGDSDSDSGGDGPAAAWSVALSTPEGSFNMNAIAVGGGGDVVIAGRYDGATVDLGGGVLPPADPSSAYGLALAADGGHRWSGALAREPNVAVDGAGNVIVFDVATLEKRDPTGAVLWHHELGSTGGIDHALAVADDDSIWFSASFLEALVIDGSPVTSPDGDVNFVRVTASGAPLWGRTLPAAAQRIAVRDPERAVVVTRELQDFQRPFQILGRDGNGDERWTREVAGSEATIGVDIDVDEAGAVLLAGLAQGAIDLGGGPVDSTFVAILDPDGAHSFSRAFNGAVTIEGVAWAGGAAILGGHLFGTYDFGGGPLTTQTITMSGLPAKVANALLVALEPDGTHRWSTLFPGGPLAATAIADIAAGADGSLVVCGSLFEGINIGGEILEPPERNGSFIAKFAL